MSAKTWVAAGILLAGAVAGVECFGRFLLEEEGSQVDDVDYRACGIVRHDLDRPLPEVSMIHDHEGRFLTNNEGSGSIDIGVSDPLYASPFALTFISAQDWGKWESPHVQWLRAREQYARTGDKSAKYAMEALVTLDNPPSAPTVTREPVVADLDAGLRNCIDRQVEDAGRYCRKVDSQLILCFWFLFLMLLAMLSFIMGINGF